MDPAAPPVPIDALLAEREWVRRLASALAANPADADDLEQDAWLAALRSPPSERGAARGWFRSVLRHRLFESARAADRRERRELAVARPEALPSTEEIVARAEAHRAVVAAVFELAEPVRTTVVLRYFEGLSTADIAERTGVPADTVRSRLRRAVTDLRARLEPDDDRRPSAWAIVLGVPLAPVASSASFAHAAAEASRAVAGSAGNSGTLTSTLVPGGVAVSSTTSKVAAAAALVLLVAGLAVWQFVLPAMDDVATGPDASTIDGGGSATVPAPADDPSRRAARAAADADGGGHALEGTPGTALLGDVRLVAGDRPAARAVVVLRTVAGEMRTTTAAAGAFRFDAAPADVSCRVAASLAESDTATATATGLRLAPGETRRLPTLWLDAPVRAEIDVVGPAREPVAGAVVEAYRVRAAITRQDWDARTPEPEATVTTAADGRAVFDRLAVGTWTFRATHAEFAPGASEPRPVLRGGVATSVEIRLDRGHELAGTITAVDGKPLADALVVALPPVEATELMTPAPLDARRVEARTDAEGRYRFAALAAGEHSIAILLDGTLPARLGIVSIPSISRFDARLDGGVLTGVVTDDATGAPVEGARIRAAVWRRHSPTYLSAVSGPDGRYRVAVPLGGILQGPARGEGDARAQPVHFDVEKDGWTYLPERSPKPWRAVFVFGGETIAFDVVLRRAATLSGTVTGPGGVVAGADVVADVWNTLRGSLPQRTTTDAEGRYRFGGLPDGRARIVVSHPGYVQVESPGDGWRGSVPPSDAAVVAIPKVGEATFDVRLARGAALRGRVSDGTGHSVAAARVTATSSDGVRRETTTTDDGGFVIDGLRPAVEASIRVACDGFSDADAKATPQAEGDSPAIEIALAAIGPVKGRVVGDAGPVAGAWVQVVPARLALDGSYEIVSVWERAPRQSVAADGSFVARVSSLGEPVDGGVVVRAGAPGFAPSLSERITLGNGVADAGTIRMETGHRLAGRVVAADGSGPIANAEIEFQNERLPPAFGQRRDWSAVGRDNMPFEFVARTGDDGSFTVENLPPWRFELRVNAQGHEGAAPTVSVPQDEPVVVELAPLAALSGRVEFEDGAPVAGAIVVAHWTDGSPGVAGFVESRDDGTFAFPFLGKARYTLEARRAWDRAMDVLPTTTPPVEAGRTDVKIVLRRGGARISGRCATAAGAAVPGASIHLRSAAGGPLLHARSAPDGRFEATSLEGGPWSVTAEATRAVGGPESFGRRIVAQATDVAAGATDVLLEFRDAAPIRGRVVRADGSAPAGRIRVQARLAPEGRWTLVSAVGADGAFRFEDATPGTWTLAVTDADTGAAMRIAGSADAEGGRTDVRLVLAGDEVIAGRVVDDRGRPVEGARVTARQSAGAASRDAVPDADGRFQIAGTAGAGWTVEARDHTTGRAESQGVASGGPELTLTLRPEEALTARVLGSGGTPLRGASIVLVADGREVARLRTDSEGRFTSRALPAGTYEVRIVERDGAPLATPVAAGSVRSGERDAILRV